MKKDELKVLCKELKIKGFTRKKKEELIEIIKRRDNVSVEVEACLKVNDPVKVEEETTSEDILSANYWKNTNAFKTIKDRETQIKYYKKMKSCEEVLHLVALESKPFGSESEKIIKEIFNIGPRTSSQHDGVKNGKKIEIKSARYWKCKDDCVWQHLEPDHDYEYVMFALLDFQGWKVWIMRKSHLMGEMRDKKILTFQGKQGWWVRKSDIHSHLTVIKTITELDAFIQSQG